MTASNKKPFLYLTLTVLAIGLLSWLLFRFNPTESFLGENRAQDPDTYMFGVTTLTLDTEGLPAQTFSASKVVHYALNDTYWLDDPHAVLFENGEKHWEITARYGKSQDKQRDVELWDDVQAVQFTQPLQINTAYIHYWPDLAFAETDQFVVLAQPDMTLESVGLKVYLDEERAELLSSVKQVQTP